MRPNEFPGQHQNGVRPCPDARCESAASVQAWRKFHRILGQGIQIRISSRSGKDLATTDCDLKSPFAFKPTQHHCSAAQCVLLTDFLVKEGDDVIE
ncbi:hypothetical protein ABFA25_02570 [Mycobacterium lepromatosis]|nr:hypothetical protein [Mycobacterium lepromatosis]